MAIGEWAYVNGEFVAAAAARVSPFDRGFLFAHAAYEVTAVYGGRLVDVEGHIARLGRTLTGLGLPEPMDGGALTALHHELMARNGLAEGVIYLQITGGAYGTRDFFAPETIAPGIFLFTEARPIIDTPGARNGIRVISVADERWARRDLKTTQLVTQALAKTAARAAGADDAWLHDNWVVTEGASANAWIVTQDGRVITRDLSNDILHGITRRKVADLLAAQGYRVRERAFSLEEAHAAAEAFNTSAGAMVAPVVQIDKRRVGTGKPGPVTRKVQRLYYAALGADAAQVAPWTLEFERAGA